METTFIYALCEPDSDTIRYVGKSDNPKRRFWDHLATSTRATTHLGNWLRLLKGTGKLPLLEVLDEVPRPQWKFWEREYIRVFRAIGINLVNGTDGGDGVVPTPETREKMLGPNNPMFGKKHSLETRRRIAEAGRGRVCSEETREKMRRFKMGKVVSEVTRDKLRQSKLGKNNHRFGIPTSEETKEKQSLAGTGRKNTEAAKANMRAAQLLRRSKEKESRGL